MSASDQLRDSGALDREAAEWIVRLTGDDAADRARAEAGFEAWRNSGPAQAAAAQRMQALIGRLHGVRDQASGETRPARAALEAAFGAARGRARRATAALMLACVGIVFGLAGLRLYPPAYLLADLRTGTGQWQSHSLPDGSRVTLSGATGVDLRFDDQHRTLVLVRGEILVDVAKDAARPFTVATEDGSVRAHGTRFTVGRRDGRTWLGVIESRVGVHPALVDGAADAAVIDAGRRVSFDRRGLGPVEAIDAGAVDDAWKLHQLVVEDRPLSEVLDTLGRYRRGFIDYDRDQIADMRVSAVLPLDRPDQALGLLQANLPGLRVRSLTPYLVWVDRPGRQ